MPKIVTIIGARPQFIKAATVSRAFASCGAREVIVHTGQHYDANMSDVFFDELRMPPVDYQLGVGGGGHGQMTGRQLEKIEEVLLRERPDWVVVYGDTNSTLAGALAAAKLHIPVAHVEAGLRSFNRKMPEEINRILTDHASDLLFVPSEAGVQNLKAEGIFGDKVRLVGDVMYDAALLFGKRARKPEWFDGLGVDVNEFVLCTIHRAENTDDPGRLSGIFQGLNEFGGPVILPVHPRTAAKLGHSGIRISPSLFLVAPVGYLEMTWLEMNCRIVATDSGGVQKEAYFHGKQCITLRNETEWSELVAGGVNTLVGADPIKIREALTAAAGNGFARQLYGNGDTAEQIAATLCGEVRV